MADYQRNWAKIIFYVIGIIFMATGIYIQFVLIPSSVIDSSTSFCSTVEVLQPNFYGYTPIIFGFGLALFIFGWILPDVAAPQPGISQDLKERPLYLLQNGKIISYEYDETNIPVIQEIVIRYNGKDYTFKISEIEVKDSDRH